MSLSNKQTKKPKKIYAEIRRKKERLDQEKLIRINVEQELTQYFEEIKFEQEENPELFYSTIYELIQRTAPNLS